LIEVHGVYQQGKRRFVCVVSLYVVETLKASIKDSESPCLNTLVHAESKQMHLVRTVAVLLSMERTFYKKEEHAPSIFRNCNIQCALAAASLCFRRVCEEHLDESFEQLVDLY